jgi:hypothetical protein
MEEVRVLHRIREIHTGLFAVGRDSIMYQFLPLFANMDVKKHVEGALREVFDKVEAYQ